MKSRIPKDTTHEFTTINTEQGSYELWNSLTPEQEQEVIKQLGVEQGSLPLSKKDQRRQRLLFGKGQFGRVRLAKKGDKFFAVKKITFTSPENKNEVLREFDFGHFLRAANIPNVISGIDGVITEDARGHEMFYLFMEDVAALGDGINLKRLLSYLPESQRSAMLIHAATSLSKTLASMHQQQIYHRDIKASNVLISSSGQIYLSDFGGAATQNSELIGNLFGEDSSEYQQSNFTVSIKSDKHYHSPEIAIALALGKPVPNDPLPVGELLDNWRFGLTLLEFSGAIKVNHGILSDLRWMRDLKPGEKSIEDQIKEHYEKEINKIIAESLHKVPIQLQGLVLGLLKVDPRERFTAADVLKYLGAYPPIDNKLLDSSIKGLVSNQVAATVKNGIKKALQKESTQRGSPDEWLAQALASFKKLLKQTDVNAQSIQNFVNDWIANDQNRPSFTTEHYEALIDRTKKRPAKVTQDKVPETVTEKAPELVSDYQTHPDKSSNYISVPQLLSEAAKSEGSPSQLKIEDEPEAPLQLQAEEEPEPILTSDDQELNRLEKELKDAANKLANYVKAKVPETKSSAELASINNLITTGLDKLKTMFYSKLAGRPEIEISTELSDDEMALKAVFARTDQIVSQLTLGKLMQFSEAERAAVERMLQKDKQFIEGISNKIGDKRGATNILNTINEKLFFLSKINRDQQLHTSTEQLEPKQLFKHDETAKTYRAQNHETKTEFTFTESEGLTSYKLPPLNEEVRSFVAKRTVKEPNKAKTLYIYSANANNGKAIGQAIMQLEKNNKNLKIYVNDQLISKSHKQGLLGFFGEKASVNIAKQYSKFKVEELPSQEISLAKK